MWFFHFKFSSILWQKYFTILVQTVVIYVLVNTTRWTHYNNHILVHVSGHLLKRKYSVLFENSSQIFSNYWLSYLNLRIQIWWNKRNIFFYRKTYTMIRWPYKLFHKNNKIMKSIPIHSRTPRICFSYIFQKSQRV